jgi:hypothetical protein
VSIGEFSTKLKQNIHLGGFHILTLVLILLDIIERSGFCVDTFCDGALVLGSKSARREDSMRIVGRTRARSSHDLLLIVGAVIAIAMIVSKMVHNWRHLPPSLGMTSTAVMVADSSFVPH